MDDLKKHGWKFIVLAILFGIAGAMDYADQTQHEVVAKAYYDELKQRYGRTYAAHLSRASRTGEHHEHHDYGPGRIRDRQDNEPTQP